MAPMLEQLGYSQQIGSCSLLTGDSRALLPTLPANHFHTCITSPPYWGLRAYLPAGHADKSLEIGQEATPEEYVRNVVQVMGEVWRVLRPDATLWIVIGDSYATGSGAGVGLGVCKPKDLVGVPWMLALALRSAGWYLRCDIILSKRNPMPGSVRDRPTRSHEYILMLSKSPTYYYDSHGYREPLAPASKSRYGYAFGGEKQERIKATDNRTYIVGDRDAPGDRNLRDVWWLSTYSYRAAHFATFSPHLVDRILRLATSERGCCAECGACRRRLVTKTRTPTRPGANGKLHDEGLKAVVSPVHHAAAVGHRDPQRHVTTVTGSRWVYGCDCRAPSVPCRVLDPFGGAATVGMVADALGCDSTIIDLYAEYTALSARRLTAALETGKLR